MWTGKTEIRCRTWASVRSPSPRKSDTAHSLCKNVGKYVKKVKSSYQKCPGIESRWGAKFSAPVQTGPGAHPASCKMGTGSFPGVKSGQGVTLSPHAPLVPWSRKSRAIPLPHLCTACTEPQCLYKGALYLFFFSYQKSLSVNVLLQHRNFFLYLYYLLRTSLNKMEKYYIYRTDIRNVASTRWKGILTKLASMLILQGGWWLSLKFWHLPPSLSYTVKSLKRFL